MDYLTPTERFMITTALEFAEETGRFNNWTDGEDKPLTDEFWDNLEEKLRRLER